MSLPIGAATSAPVISPIERAESTLQTTDGSASFGDLFTKALNDTSGMQGEAKDMIGAFLRGEPVELHQVMAASEEATISLELLVEVRNKLTEAYRAVMNVS